MAQYSQCLLAAEAMAELVVNMRSPKNTLRQVSEVISLQQLRYRSTVTQLNPDYYVRPLCSCNAFNLKWKHLPTPLQLDLPTSKTYPRAARVVGPADS